MAEVKEKTIDDIADLSFEELEKYIENGVVISKEQAELMHQRACENPDGRLLFGRDVDEKGNLLPKK